MQAPAAQFKETQALHPALSGMPANGAIEVKTPHGKPSSMLRCRTLQADLIKERSKRRVDAQLMRDAIGGYFKVDGRDLARLAKMCEVVGVRNELQTYLEVLT